MTQEYSYRKSTAMFRNKPVTFTIYVLLVPAYGIGVFLLLIWYLNSRFNVLKIKGDEVHFDKGLFNKDHKEMNISRIRSVHVKQSFFQRIFSVGDIEFFTAGDLPELSVKGMPNPNTVRNIIRERKGLDPAT